MSKPLLLIITFSIKTQIILLGALVMNVLPAKETDEEVMLVQVQRALSAVFPLCVRMRMGRQLNGGWGREALKYLLGMSNSAHLLRFPIYFF